MIIWTIQSLHVWEMLQREGILYGPTEAPEFVCESIEWRTAYHWLIEQMEQRIGPRPNPEAYPLWAWYQWENAPRRKPDLRTRGHLAPGKKGVRIEFEITDDQILLSDFDMWHFPLNYGYLALTEQESEAFYTETEQKGYAYRELMEHPHYRPIILKSWERIFDLDYIGDPNWTGAKTRAEKRIQGTFWQLSLNQVRKVTFFTSRNAGQWLSSNSTAPST